MVAGIVLGAIFLPFCTYFGYRAVAAMESDDQYHSDHKVGLASSEPSVVVSIIFSLLGVPGAGIGYILRFVFQTIIQWVG